MRPDCPKTPPQLGQLCTCRAYLPPQHRRTLQAHCQAKQLGTLEAASQNVNTLCSHGAGLLVTLFLALTALQFVISSNLPNSRCGAHLGLSVTRLVLGFRHALCRLSFALPCDQKLVAASGRATDSNVVCNVCELWCCSARRHSTSPRVCPPFAATCSRRRRLC